MQSNNTALSVNVNKVAWLRNARGGQQPSVVDFSRQCLEGGAAGITVHPRQDQRHIKYQDAYDLAELLKDFPEAEFNIEGTPNEELLNIVMEIKPHQCTLVPDSPDQLTSDHGWNVAQNESLLRDVIARLSSAGIRTCLFVDMDEKHLQKIQQVGANRIELYTGPYADNYGTAAMDSIVKQFSDTARAAVESGLEINAGHDLNQVNLAHFLANVEQVKEVSIGHAFVCDCLQDGLSKTLAGYLKLTNGV